MNNAGYISPTIADEKPQLENLDKEKSVQAIQKSILRHFILFFSPLQSEDNSSLKILIPLQDVP